MSSKPDIHIQASSFTFHCDIFHFDIISSLFPTSHVTTCDIRSLSFLSSWLTRHYPCFTLSGGFSRVTAWRIVTFFPSIHPMGSGSEILFWEVVLLARIHIILVCEESLIIWVCIFMGGHCGPTFFTCVPTWLARLTFICENVIFGKVGVATYFIFYFKGKIKQERKTLKSDFIIFGKNMSLKNPSLSSGIRLLIGKVPLGGSTPLSPKEVSTD